MVEVNIGVAVVTGAARRIGRVIALDLAAQGWAVAVHCHRSEADANETVDEIRHRGGAAARITADLADERQLHTIISGATRELGPVTCLINNASIFEDDHIATVTADSLDRHLAINMRAPLFLTQAFAAQLPDGEKGNVINVIDQRVWNLTPYFTSYSLSKSGLWSLTQISAMALAPDIRVNAIGPGPTFPSPRQSPEQFERQWSNVPLGEAVPPEQIGEAVRFILAASSMTGQMIALDGGQHLGWAQPAGKPLPDE